MSDERAPMPWLPPAWVIHVAWRIHRCVYRLTRGHLGLWRPKPSRWGTLRLTTTGRRSGQQRSVILAYLQDGPNLVTLAMNGWQAPEPLWWLNLQAHPAATVVAADSPTPIPVTARAAEGEERSRLWATWLEIDPKLDAYAARRPNETAVVVLEPLAAAATP